MSLLVTRKTLDKMGSQINEKASRSSSTFALKAMARMGWTEGKGLGANEDGMQKSIKAKKLKDGAGLGEEKRELDEEQDDWWRSAFDKGMERMDKGKSKRSKKEKKAKKDKKDKKDKKEKKEKPKSGAAPTFEELFKATGGARLGMRARAKQTGKLRRTEGDGDTKGGNTETKEDISRPKKRKKLLD
jgi:Pin2-interacting protein X1